MSEQQLEPRAGEVWLIDCDPQVGREQGGIRPALVISTDYFNRLPNELYVVAPITTRNRGLRLHLPLAPPEGGVRKPSVIMCDQIKAASDRRMLERWGLVSDETLADVRQMVRLIIEGEPFGD
ncbi:MAG: type II toxin-antitoxin system PemK/MazF family toxin [Thermomicrobiales bacterium]|nr:type II toxin-antitoxin system PemK/MazF family toxin [Thermomicrobiales bacterium]